MWGSSGSGGVVTRSAVCGVLLRCLLACLLAAWVNVCTHDTYSTVPSHPAVM